MRHSEILQPAHGDRLITLLETLVCVSPAMAALYVGRPDVTASLLFGTASIVLAVHALARQPARYMAFAVSLVPPVLLVRNQFYFSSLLAFFAAGLILWWIVRPEEVIGLFSSLSRRLLVVGALAYWLISWASTGFYSTNIHVVELALTACGVFLLGRSRYALATALLAMTVSLFCVGAGAFPYGDRLGLVELGYMSLGNPISFGSSAGLIFLLCTIEGGRWLDLERRHLLRLAIALGSAAFLTMSTSRGSWFMTIAGLTIGLAADRKYRLRGMSVAVLVPVCAIALALSTGRGAAVVKYVNKVADSDRTLSQKTTGRFNQWEALPEAFAASPVWGHGGGSGVDVYQEIGGKQLAWHSLYLQLLVETGLIGFCFMMGLLIAVAGAAWRHWQLTAEVVPLQSLICYCVIGLSISAFDAMSGIFLGLALLGNDCCSHWHVYRATVGVFRANPVLNAGRPELTFRAGS